MGFFDGTTNEDAWNQVRGAPHKAELSHELLSGAAAFAAAKEYEKHCAANGKPVEHAEAKELIAGFAGAFLDNIIETKGLDEVDKIKAHHKAKEQLENEVLAKDYPDQY